MAMNEDEARLCLIADIDSNAASCLATSADAQSCSPAELVLSGEIDAVIVATPPDSHEALCMPLLKRGVAVLCEKPLGITLDAANRLEQASNLEGTLLCVSSKFVFAESVTALATMIREGEISASSLSLDFSLGLDLIGSWQIDPAVGGGGVLMDRGPQAIDLIRTLLGEPQRITALRPSGSPYAVEDMVDMHVELSNGRHADCVLSWRRTSDSDIYARLICDEAIVELGWSEARIWRPGSGWERFGPGYDQHQAFSDQCRAFIRAARGEGEFGAPLISAVANQILIDNLYSFWRTESPAETA